jgi:hypothetical protein
MLTDGAPVRVELVRRRPLQREKGNATSELWRHPASAAPRIGPSFTLARLKGGETSRDFASAPRPWTEPNRVFGVSDTRTPCNRGKESFRELHSTDPPIPAPSGRGPSHGFMHRRASSPSRAYRQIGPAMIRHRLQSQGETLSASCLDPASAWPCLARRVSISPVFRSADSLRENLYRGEGTP